MVIRNLCILTVLLFSANAFAQDGYVRAWVADKTVQAEQEFWLFVELSGSKIEDPVMPESDDLIININNPQMSRRTSIRSTPSGTERNEILKFTFLTRAIKEGNVTIPSVSAIINGNKMESDPIVLTVTEADPDDLPDPESIKMWVNRRTVYQGEWFWIYLEATGFDVDMPDTIEADGLQIDTSQVSNRSVTSQFNRTGVSTYKRGYYARATRPGTIEIPPVEFLVSRRMARSNSLELNVVADPGKMSRAQAARPGVPDPSTGEQPKLTRDDLVFIRMNTDKTEAYVGEQILFKAQLWQINYNNISTGPLQGALNIPPTTEGFYVDELEPKAYEQEENTWNYNVHERRKLLYPTRSGELEIGKWHWEGVALINRHSIRNRERIGYVEDQGPIMIDVKPLPPSPEGFSGGVGDYQVEATLESNTGATGMPVEFMILVRGQGNADALGAPIMPNLPWAHLSEPEVVTRAMNNPGDEIPTMIKAFHYKLTPLRGGTHTIPEFGYATFNPVTEDYDIASIGPYSMNIEVDGSAPQHLVAPDDVSLVQRTVRILQEDIQPMLEPPGKLRRTAGRSTSIRLLFLLPVVAYGVLAVMMSRRRRLQEDVGYARSRVAKSKGIKGLKDVYTSDEPSDALFRTVSRYIGDKFNVEDKGMTSADVDELLREHNVDREIRDTISKILKSCERARYGSQSFNSDEVRALVQAAESAIHDFDDWLTKGTR